jgi:hypothetical protein
VAQLWSFLRNFSASKYYDAVQQGAMNGAAPFSFGAIFATIASPPSAGQAIFANAATVNTGFALNVGPGTGNVTMWNGTIAHNTGPIVASTGAALAPATDLTTSEALANAFFSNENANQTIGTSRGLNSPHSVQLVFAVLTVPATGNQSFYINGHLNNIHAVNLATAVNPVVIGAFSPGHTSPADETWLAGCFYHDAVYSATDVAAMFQASAAAKDLVGPGRYGTALDPKYMWSVKRANFDARANWISDGSALTPITMVQHGIWTTSGATSDVFGGADLPWMQA